MSEPITDAEILEWEATAQSMAWFTVTETEFFVITRTVLNRLIAEVRRCWQRAEKAEAERDELRETNEYLEARRGGECKECGCWVCPPLTCLGCLANLGPEDEHRKTNQRLTSENESLRQRVEKAKAKNKPLEQSVFEMKAWVAELQDCLKKAEAENDELSKRAGEAEKLSVRLYSQGYGRGHDDTVEGVYIDVLPCDEETYFQDEVLCITRKVADAARKGKE